MRQNPQALANDLRETLCTYLETAYRLSHPALTAERAALLRAGNVIGQEPFVETTPRFPAGSWLKDIHLPQIPQELSDLTQHGLTTGKFPLYAHQEEALRSAWDANGRPRDLVVASGTGSGKTECFYLPILADILREALTWSAPRGQYARGQWDARGKRWLHSRRHETREPAVRAIVLYPMNALVNDQLRRLRKMLNSEGAQQWQGRHLNGNQIYFGRYTGQTEVAGDPEQSSRQTRWKEYISGVEESWDNVGDAIRDSGGVARPDGSEMLCRWDMQQAPPDVLITNYSMLEYMLVRPIEADIFRKTREWLARSKDHVLTLVLDEAHSYSGARGTEVAFLIRRLYERLGAAEGQIRCIATSASLGETQAAQQEVETFMSNLFGHPPSRFKFVRAQRPQGQSVAFAPAPAELAAFSAFQDSIDRDTEQGATQEHILHTAAARLLQDLNLPVLGSDPSQSLYRALEQYPGIVALRQHTAGKARPFAEVSENLWGTLGTSQDRSQATAALLAAGAYARPLGEQEPDVPPLVPSRLHLMYRGLPGLWACLDPACPKAPASGPRPCGKLYTEPRIWCECRARVLEVFSCRVCGLLFLGGIPEGSVSGRLWPYQPKLEGGMQDYSLYRVFAAEDPGAREGDEWAIQHCSFRTTQIMPEASSETRVVWTGNTGLGEWLPNACPRCDQAKNHITGREVIEPFKTKGPQQLAALMQQAFRLQPARTQSQPTVLTPTPTGRRVLFGGNAGAARIQPPQGNPNRGRKALIFSDGRQAAATLAGDLTFNHARDLFRQLILCVQSEHLQAHPGEALPVPDLRERVIEMAIKRGIDPSLGELDPPRDSTNGFWRLYQVNPQNARKQAERFVDAYLRREMADRQLGVEPLALARWTLNPAIIDFESFPALSPLSQVDTLGLLSATLRLLASENTVLPEDLNPESWPHELVQPYYRRTVIRPPLQQDHSFVWDSGRNNRLTRYMKKVAASAGLGDDGVAVLMDKLWAEYLDGNALMTVSGGRHGWGIPLDRLALAPLPDVVFVCDACGYICAETPYGICLRCHGHATPLPHAQATALQRNYYRRLADLATAAGDHPDPFPLHVLEHTAQISAQDAARRERYFQDQFIQEGAQKEDPLACGVDMLSVTTTMEMGIDIGDLTTVGMHNMPPTVANYQQRAGRAGRRSDGVAAVLTYARDRSHDQYYFREVAEIVTGAVRIPRLHLDNEVIAQRHIHALVLQRFFADAGGGGAATGLFQAFGSVATFKQDNPSQLDGLRQKLTGTAFGAEMEAAGRVVMPDFAAQIPLWISALPDLLRDTVEAADEASDLLDVFITRGVLPRYAFPVDLVALWTQEPNRYNRGEEVQRDLQIALSEYAPGAEVVVDGKIYKSAGVYSPFNDAAEYKPSAWYYECPVCKNVQVADGFMPQHPWSACTLCHTPITPALGRRPLPALKPDGFRTDWGEAGKKYRGGSRDRAGYSKPAQLVAGETADKGNPDYEGRLFVHHRVGQLYMVNQGPADQPQPGFWICPRCGRNLTSRTQAHQKPEPGHHECRGQAGEESILLHGFRSFVALLAVVFPDAMEAPLYRDGQPCPGGRAAWVSLSTALLQAAATYLQVDAGELAGGVRPWMDPNGRHMAEVFLHDTLPNGAGYAEEIVQELDVCLRRAKQICEGCPRQCETACYSCLMDYGNQREHALLDRRLAVEVIDFILDGLTPSLPQAREEAALEKLRPFITEGTMDLNVPSDGTRIPGQLSLPGRNLISLWPLHTLCMPTQNPTQIAIDTGTQPVFVSEFDLTRRPFWVWGQIMQGKHGRL